MKLFVNGHQDRNTTSSKFTFKANESFRIGATKAYPRYFDGLIDDFRVYNRALTQAEIKTLVKGVK